MLDISCAFCGDVVNPADAEELHHGACQTCIDDIRGEESANAYAVINPDYSHITPDIYNYVPAAAGHFDDDDIPF